MPLGRVFRHLLTTGRAVRRHFPPAALAAIEQAIRDSEKTHSGELRFVVEAALDPAALVRGTTPRERALELFSSLRVWDTEHNNGVLIYVLLADHDVEIVVDRGVHARTGTAPWEAMCRQMEDACRRQEHAAGALRAVRAAGAQLALHFPAAGSVNELPDPPLVV